MARVIQRGGQCLHGDAATASAAASRPRAWRAALAWTSALFLLAVLAGCSGGATAPPDAGGQLARDTAPAFTLPRLDGEGQLGPTDLRGRVIVLNVWASWCAPCRAEAPTLGAVARAFDGRGVTVLGVNIQDTPEAARRFVRDYDVAYTNLRDEAGTVALAYGALGLPTTVFIDRQGRIARRWVGPLSERQLVAFIEEIN